jgi:hypothetical protein
MVNIGVSPRFANTALFVQEMQQICHLQGSLPQHSSAAV